MLVWFRAGLAAALFVVARHPPVQAAEKTFQDAALDDAAITLEAELKEEAGTVEKPVAKLKKEAEALLKAQDLQAAADVYIQIVTVAPERHVRRGARSPISGSTFPRPTRMTAPTRFEQARTAAYIAYQRSANAERRSGLARHLRRRLGQARRIGVRR